MTNQEKGERLNKILEKLGNNPNDETCNADMHNLLLEDCGGKLYKYMPFRDYTISSLQNNTLHFSSPADFNDPFDCKIGFNIFDLAKDCFKKELDTMDLYLSDFLALREGRKSIEEIPQKRLPVIKYWTSNKRLMSFFDAYEGRPLSTEEVHTLLLNNFDVVGEILAPILNLVSPNDMSIISAWISKLFENMSDEYKRLLIEGKLTISEYLKSLGAQADADETDQLMQASEKIQPENKNAIEQLKKSIYALECQVKTSLESRLKICCLTTDYTNKLMWSHYADSHKGICVEYDFSDSAVNKSQPLPVYYSHERPQYAWKLSQESKSKGSVCLMKALLTKEEEWSYENEWRMFISAETEPDNVPAPPIKCIYIGASCTKENTEKIVDTAKTLKIPVKRMTIDRGKYELHAVEI